MTTDNETDGGPMLTIEGLRKTYHTRHGEVEASKGLTFTVDEGEILALVGPSGCGKTTALRCVAGLETPDGGRIVIDGREVYSASAKSAVSPEHRDVGMVFQSYAVWPHMTVYENVAYPLRVSKERIPREELDRRVREALALVRISELADRRPAMLSGGQQQRVAIARAVARGSKVLLFDEPLSNLDAKLREEMRGELRALCKSVGATVLYVTHDLSEALALADRLLVLDGGTIAQEGAPEDIYFRPRSVFVASFLGHQNLLSGNATAQGDRIRIDTPVTSFTVGADASPVQTGAVSAVIRPEALSIRPVPDGQHDATIEESLFLGSTVEYLIRGKTGESLIARLPSLGERLAVQRTVAVTVDPSGVTLIDESA
ncbi:ABC transporter ATP-binding protein [Microbacterium gorillae]|uniref:ABC transporter ATP-binding protein n=1 Tax=Microbacterium gorillae TaxID=1231063 RepID=UPI00069342D1|nr:ABC transporter ATP-binding protein [Microbacterium gorillae]